MGMVQIVRLVIQVSSINLRTVATTNCRNCNSEDSFVASCVRPSAVGLVIGNQLFAETLANLFEDIFVHLGAWLMSSSRNHRSL